MDWFSKKELFPYQQKVLALQGGPYGYSSSVSFTKQSKKITDSLKACEA